MTSRTDNLSVALVQCDLKDNDVEANLSYLSQVLEAKASLCDLIVFPETLTTAFSSSAYDFADKWGEGGRVYDYIKALAKKYQVGIAGSYLTHEEEGRCYNRFFLFDEVGQCQYQDKRHLFTLGGESEHLHAASERRVFNFKGWKILPLVCYDLRFPVWLRNQAGDEYDLMICVANWPKARRLVWQTLLKARALENLSFVIGVNRIGIDKQGLVYSGDSRAISPRGEDLVLCQEGIEDVKIVNLDYQSMSDLRRKFPVHQDADSFILN